MVTIRSGNTVIARTPVPVTNHHHGAPDVDDVQRGLIDALVSFGVAQLNEDGEPAYFIRVETFPAPAGGRFAHIQFGETDSGDIAALVITFDSSGLVLSTPSEFARDLSDILKAYGESIGDVYTFDSDEVHEQHRAEQEATDA